VDTGIGAEAVNGPTVLIASDECEFPNAITTSWLREGNPPGFVVSSGSEFAEESFDLAIVGALNGSADFLLSNLCRTGKPVIQVTRVNGGVHRPAVISVPEIQGWPELVVAVGKQILQRAEADLEVARLSQLGAQLESMAALGRYIIEMRHNLNNALTSILGNSDLILLDEERLPSVTRAQIETIRNMGLRLNEIMARLTSLQKEMQLVEQQKKAAARSPASGV
jgi:signal transduction histidine kinase